jgi:broad specificity phosphatase PhoE
MFRRMRIVLIRHGRPDMGRSRWIGHAAFARFIDDYQASGLDGSHPPPAELVDLVRPARFIFTSELQRSIESAHMLRPGGQITSTPLFTESPLASPPLPGLRMKAPAWAVISRVAWHGGFKPGIESYAQSKQRARQAADLLVAEAEASGLAVLVAHGYFNAILGRTLHLNGWRKISGAHRARFWNTVVYERDAAALVRPPKLMGSRRVRQLRERIRAPRKAA